MTWTTYCMKHAELELVGDVTDITTFLVYEGALKTARSACEVRAITAAGCKVHFIGGPAWNR